MIFSIGNGVKIVFFASRFWRCLVDILCQLAAALAHCHGLRPNPIIHCDVKPGNVLVQQLGGATSGSNGAGAASRDDGFVLKWVWSPTLVH